MVWFGAISSACDTPSQRLLIETDVFGEERQAIYNGSLADESEYGAVVSLVGEWQSGLWISYCSGTLIAPDLVMTAAHCGFGGRVYVGVEPDEPIETAETAAEQVEVYLHPNYVGTGTVTDDIALIKIEPPITSVDIIPPLPPAYALSMADIGDDLTFVGFGLSDRHFEADDPSLTVDRRKVDLPLTGFCQGAICNPSYLDEGELEYDHTGAGPCQGDSGGPALIRRDGQLFAMGVASTINNADCPDATAGHHTLVDHHFEDFILPYLRKRGMTLNICQWGVDDCSQSAPCVFDAAEDKGYKCGGCPSGFVEGASGQCEDVDECANNPCTPDETCVNVDGYFDCQINKIGTDPDNPSTIDPNIPKEPAASFEDDTSTPGGLNAAEAGCQTTPISAWLWLFIIFAFRTGHRYFRPLV